MTSYIQSSFISVLMGISSLVWANVPARAQESGAQLWANTCARCHNMRDPGDFRDQNWRPIVAHMRVRAALTGEDARQILAFLQRSNQPNVQRVAAVSTTEPAADLGAAIYQRDCAACHGKDGKGTLPGVRDFNAADGPLAKSDDELQRNIANGYKSPGSALAMPGRGGNPSLTDSDIRSVLLYLRQAFGKRK